MIFQGSSSATVPNMGHHGTLHKARNADFMGTTVISRAAAEPVNTQETLNWRAFSVGGQPRPPQDGQQRAADCDSPARFFLRRKRFRPEPPKGTSIILVIVVTVKSQCISHTGKCPDPKRSCVGAT